MAEARARRSSYYQDAVRILFLLDAAGEDPGPGAPPGAVTVIPTQMRLQALDFWLRNPDYLAGELLNEYDAGRRGEDAVAAADEVLNSEEPDLHRYPMTRWLYGAYEPLDNALGVLISVGFVAIRRVPRSADGNEVARHDYYLLEAGRSAIESIISEYPELQWYRTRAAIVADLAGDTPGARLKDRQHAQATYHDTSLGINIGPIEEAVRQRLAELRP